MWVLALLLLPLCCSCYRILGFFPYPGPSHQKIFASVLHALAARGHHVVFLTSHPPQLSHPNLEVRTIPNFHKEYVVTVNLSKLGVATIPQVSNMIGNAFLASTDRLYGQEEAQKLIHGSEHFHAVLMNSMLAQEAVSALTHKFGCVGIEVSTAGDSAWANELAGLPNNPAYQLDFKVTYTEKLKSFGERCYNFYATWSTALVSYWHLLKQQEVMDKYFNYTGWESRPPISQLVSNKSIIFVNNQEVLGYPQPLAPHMKNVGGVTLQPLKPLPQDIQKYLDEAKDGVIYVSFGSNLKTSEIASGDFGKAFMDVFKKLPHRILMKWESDSKNAAFPDNVMTLKWVPQQDVLAHKNIRLFVSHGGLLSLTEATFLGVPIVGIPFFGDQMKNMKFVEQGGYGIYLSHENITFQSVSWALDLILNDPRYKREAVRRSQMLRDQRHSAAEEVVYWTEHAIKYPNSLQPESARLSFVQLHNLDILLFLLAGILGVFFLLRQICTFCRPSVSKVKVKVS